MSLSKNAPKSQQDLSEVISNLETILKTISDSINDIKKPATLKKIKLDLTKCDKIKQSIEKSLPSHPRRDELSNIFDECVRSLNQYKEIYNSNSIESNQQGPSNSQSNDVLHQNLMTQEDQEKQQLESLNNATGEILEDMKALNDTTIQLNEKIQESHEVLIKIDEKIEETHEEMIQGNKELVKAETHQKESGKCLIYVLLILLLIVILIGVYFFIINKKK